MQYPAAHANDHERLRGFVETYKKFINNPDHNAQWAARSHQSTAGISDGRIKQWTYEEGERLANKFLWD